MHGFLISIGLLYEFPFQQRILQLRHCDLNNKFSFQLQTILLTKANLVIIMICRGVRR